MKFLKENWQMATLLLVVVVIGLVAYNTGMDYINSSKAQGDVKTPLPTAPTEPVATV